MSSGDTVLNKMQPQAFEDGVDETTVGAPVEQLACPTCRENYAFGDICPSCDVLLVSSSFVDSAPPEKSGARRGWLARFF